MDRQTVNETLAEEGLTPAAAIPGWYDSADVTGWVKDIVEVGATKGLYEWTGDHYSYARLPSVSLKVGYELSLILRTVGELGKILPSDDHDEEHCAAGGYFDVLVTADKTFMKNLAKMKNLPFEVLDPETLQHS